MRRRRCSPCTVATRIRLWWRPLPAPRCRYWPGPESRTRRQCSSAAITAHGCPWLSASGSAQAPAVDGRVGPATTVTAEGLGVPLGAGMIAVLPQDRCGIVETAAILRFLALESAGQCGPCLNGLPRIAAAFDALARPAPQADLAGDPREPVTLGPPGHRARRVPPPRRLGPPGPQRSDHVRRRGGRPRPRPLPGTPAARRCCPTGPAEQGA